MGNVHRMELSGVLSGLFRVVRFTQDDAHVFLSDDQVGDEISNMLDLINVIYKDTFGFEPEIELSTRPEKFMGDKKDWDKSEKALESALKKSKVKYKINEGDGAFYGPKIDLHIKDSLNRSWQCGTIQLDMQMPERFEIEYVDKDGKKKTPMVIHRALFGSFERFIGILLEHFKGALPLWLSPTQVKVLSFTERNDKAVEKLVKGLKEKIPGLRVEADLRDTTVGDKVRDAEMLKVPYMIVIGDKEEEANSLAVRKRGVKKVEYGVSVGDFVREVRDKIESKGLD
jgi:threonyl-tRNA synthetase